MVLYALVEGDPFAAVPSPKSQADKGGAGVEPLPKLTGVLIQRISGAVITALPAAKESGFLNIRTATETALHLQGYSIVATGVRNGGWACVGRIRGDGAGAQVPVIGQVAGARGLIDKIHYKGGRAGGGDLVGAEVRLYSCNHPQVTGYSARVGTTS